MLKISSLILFIFLYCSAFSQTQASFEVISKKKSTSIFYDKTGSSLDSISAYLLARDIAAVSGQEPFVTTNKNEIKGNVIVIGKLGNSVVNDYLKEEDFPDNFKNQKESFLYKVIDKQPNKTLIIAGTDARGTAYGVFELSEKIGVSPWYWWADVPVKKHEEIILEQPEFYSKAPSVEFRGIFLNDEDWGLQPWAEKTFEPEVGDIGPKTYSKIFELLLRLKANTIWPAMHPSTKAFFHYPVNPIMAEKYQIVIGSSHAEPMLRNNVDEWDKDTMGAFNYISNKENVYKYWEKRVKEAGDIDGIYTLGMRGIHDSGMEGVKGIEEATANLQNVFSDQREILKKNRDVEITKIPQAFTVYKEVLDLYDHGLQVPEDVTIIWTDDNYGYIRRLSNEKERIRKGGGGVYYHASYWGRPHDYQWLSNTHPSLIREEMMKAYKTNSRKMWILNVGDLKPAEYNMQFFLDMAYDIEKFKDPKYVDEHLNLFYSSIFGKEVGKKIAQLKKDYYNLAIERKPEFMGWSQTEPTTEIDTTSYNPFAWGNEVKRRLERYNSIENKAERIQQKISDSEQDAYFQLVYYPVKGASLMNKKFLFRDLALKYNQEGRLNAENYKKRSHASFDSIKAITKKYNNEVSEGKWKHYMDMAPRRLPVFENPEIYLQQNEGSEIAGLAVEGNLNQKNLILPVFYKQSNQKHFFDLFLKKQGRVNWQLKNLPNYIDFSRTEGKLSGKAMDSQQRIWTNINWTKWEKAGKPQQTSFSLSLGPKEYSLQIKIKSYLLPKNNYNYFIEQNGMVVIYAENYSKKTNSEDHKWQRLPGLGYSKNLMQALPVTAKPLDTLQLKEKSPVLNYDIYLESKNTTAQLILNALPTHPLTNEHSLRLGVQWNDEPIEIVDFRTFGRSETWKQNVLRNLAKVKIPVDIKESGKYRLKLYMIDQGLSLDFIYLNIKNKEQPYSLLPETRVEIAK